jgi:hypothetical protein
VGTRAGSHVAADTAAAVPILRLPVAERRDRGVSGPLSGNDLPQLVRTTLRRSATGCEKAMAQLDEEWTRNGEAFGTGAGEWRLTVEDTTR